MKIKALLISMFVIIAGLATVITINEIENDTTSSENVESGDEIPELGDIVSFDDAVNAFSFDIYKKFFEDPANIDNIFTSPYSIFVALAMTYEGANGETAEEMKQVLNIEQDNESFHNYMKSLYTYLNYNDLYNISTANALWIKENYPIFQAYKDLILEYYGGDSTDMDFSNPAQAADIINSWIEEQTNNLIKDLISPADIDPVLTTMILTNAIYFKGTWKVQFDEQNTSDDDFTLSNGETIQVPTMKLTETQNTFYYNYNEDMQMLELPYTGDNISMVIFLPKDGKDLSDVINYLNHESYANLIDSATKTEVDIYLPKFKIETPIYNLNEYLKELGMPKAFSGEADFSGMTDFEQLYISKVLHKAFIDVNEEGTEAAAATAVIIFKTSYPNDNEDPRIEFKADHPFLFTIHHKDTNTILFMGEVINPTYDE